MILGFLIGGKKAFQAEGKKMNQYSLEKYFSQCKFFSENKIITFFDCIKLNISVGVLMVLWVLFFS